jgi:Sulfatase
VTLAIALKAQGYATGQFGKNHLGDLNKYLPTLHGFDEFFGYLYHLDAMSDPYSYSFPVNQDYYNKYGPRSLIHSYASDTDDPTEMPRWGRVGKQRIVDEGPLPPFPDMSNVPNMHDLPFLKARAVSATQTGENSPGKRIGLEIPPTLLARADEVIE